MRNSFATTWGLARQFPAGEALAEILVKIDHGPGKDRRGQLAPVDARFPRLVVNHSTEPPPEAHQPDPPGLGPG
jgi:hypothetical protein